MQTGVKEEKETYSSQVSSQAYRSVDHVIHSTGSYHMVRFSKRNHFDSSLYESRVWKQGFQQNSTSSYFYFSEIDWRDEAPATKRQKDNEFDEDDESFLEASQSSSMMS